MNPPFWTRAGQIANAAQALAAVALSIHAVAFADFEQRNVGPTVVYTAYTLAVVATAQAFNGLLWIKLRRADQPTSALRRAWCAATLGVVGALWAGSAFMYAADPTR